MFFKFIAKMNIGLGIGAGFLVFAMMVVILREVIGRYFLGSPAEWVGELSSDWLLLGVFYLGAGYAFMAGGFVKVDILLSRVKPKWRALVEAIHGIIALIYCAVIVWQGTLLALWSLRRNMVSYGMGWPLFPTQVLVPIGAILVILSLISFTVYQLKFFSTEKTTISKEA